jgi:glycerophosphoryl diester phosphodiesterase
MNGPDAALSVEVAEEGARTVRERWGREGLGVGVVCAALMMVAQGCATTPTTVPVLRGPTALVIAHRGGSLEAPENTLASMRHGLRAGADWLELDVHLTADGEVVVIHDDNVDRTTDGTGRVEDLTWSELERLNAGRPRWDGGAAARLGAEGTAPRDFGARFASARIPKLAEVLDLAGARVMIELKHTKKGEALVRGVLEVIAKSHAEDRVGIASFDVELLDIAHRLAPKLPLIGLVGGADQLPVMAQRPLAVLAVNQALVAAARDHLGSGVALWTWTIYSADRAKALDLDGVDGLITDAPAKVLEALRGIRPLPES